MHRYDEGVIKAFISATYRLVDPRRAELSEQSPYMVTGGSALDYAGQIAHARARTRSTQTTST